MISSAAGPGSNVNITIFGVFEIEEISPEVKEINVSTITEHSQLPQSQQRVRFPTLWPLATTVIRYSTLLTRKLNPHLIHRKTNLLLFLLDDS